MRVAKIRFEQLASIQGKVLVEANGGRRRGIVFRLQLTKEFLDQRASAFKVCDTLTGRDLVYGLLFRPRLSLVRQDRGTTRTRHLEDRHRMVARQ